MPAMRIPKAPARNQRRRSAFSSDMASGVEVKAGGCVAPVSGATGSAQRIARDAGPEPGRSAQETGRGASRRRARSLLGGSQRSARRPAGQSADLHLYLAKEKAPRAASPRGTLSIAL